MVDNSSNGWGLDDIYGIYYIYDLKESWINIWIVTYKLCNIVNNTYRKNTVLCVKFENNDYKGTNKVRIKERLKSKYE